jgi:ATP-binding cassette, subfamily B, bacterial
VAADAERTENAFHKARSYLNFNARAKWAAHIAAAGTAVLTVALLMVLYLFTDLMVYRGRVPQYQDLTPAQQHSVASVWERLSAEERREWLEGGGVPAGRAKGLAEARFEDLTPADAEVFWVEDVRRTLRDSVGPDAEARVVRAAEEEPAGAAGKVGSAAGGLWPWAVAVATPAGRRATLDRGDHGVLSLVVREHAGGRWLPTPIPWLARWNHWMWNDSTTWLPPYLTGLFVFALALAVFATGAAVLMREMAARATIEATTRLRRAVYHHTFRLGTLAIRALGPSEAVSILTRHIEAVHDALYTWLTVVFYGPILFGVLLVFALLLNLPLALAFLTSAVLVWLAGAWIVGYFRRRSRAATHHAAERLTIIRESLMLMRLVKAYIMEQFNQARIERQLSRYARAQLIRHRADATAGPLLTLLGLTCALVLLFVGALVVLNGRLSVPGAVVLAATFICLYRPAERWLEAQRILRRGKESAAQVFKFLERRGEVGQVVGAEFLPPLGKQLEFDNVTLRDPSTGRTLLENVSVTIPAGHRVGLVGADNLEKHALVYLIPRLLDPTTGEIRIDQHNLRWVTLDSLRAQIGIVMMHNLVFHDTVANNIGCGDSGYTLPQIIEAAKVAHAHHFIQKLPQGYETPIGELGHSLTVSEQYRIALARAILRDPALLIIEEPEADLDEDTKNLLDDTMARLLPGRTVVFLPHRISTLRSCNTVYLLNKGRVAASGLHKELLAGNPLYRHLHYLEFAEVAEQV